MNKPVGIVIFIALLASVSVSADPGGKHWRVGGTFVYYPEADTQDLLGNGWGVNAEYSYGNSLGGDSEASDSSFAISYKRNEKDYGGFNRDVEHWFFGLRWRNGSGSSPQNNGAYGGLGLGVAVLNISPGLADSAENQNTTKLEYQVFGGVNFAGSWYLEIGWNGLPEVSEVDLGTVTATLGIRL